MKASTVKACEVCEGSGVVNPVDGIWIDCPYCKEKCREG